jgi:hypothetical protein
MKKNNYCIVLVALVLFITGCKKFLQIEPTDFLTPDSYFNNQAQLEAALRGVYDRLQHYTMYQDGWWSRASSTDEQYFNAQTQRTETNFVTINDQNVRDAWTNCYQGIERANLLLENISKPVMNEQVRLDIKGQALFLRAYYYYLLVINYGDVPLKLSSTKAVEDTKFLRTSIKDVYAQILKDLQEAQSILPKISTLGYNGKASKTAAQAILARVCLTMAGEPLKDIAKFQDAKNWCDSVIQSGEHALSKNYAQIFINHSQDKYDIKECLWEVEFYGNGVGNSFNESSRLGVSNGPQCSSISYGYSFASMRPTEKLYKLYQDTTDFRLNWNICPWSYRNAANPGFLTNGAVDPAPKVNRSATQIWERFTGKWYREQELLSPKSQQNAPTNFPVIRYADVLLMYAEAENEINGNTTAGINAINQVRRRGYGKLEGELIKTIILGAQGTGYTTAPTVVFTGGGGSGASATATVSGGKVTGITITNRGYGYTAPPTISFTGGAGSGATATVALTTITDADLTATQTATQAALRDAIRDERARELCYEATRKPDLIRWGIYVQTMQQMANDIRATAPTNFKFVATIADNIQERNKLWPIPASEIALNPLLTQNPGW